MIIWMLISKSIRCDPLALESVNDVSTRDSLAMRVVSVHHSVLDDFLQEYLQDRASLFVYKPRNLFHAAAPSQSENSRLGYSLNAVL